jgi:hypothetical protein
MLMSFSRRVKENSWARLCISLRTRNIQARENQRMVIRKVLKVREQNQMMTIFKLTIKIKLFNRLQKRLKKLSFTPTMTSIQSIRSLRNAQISKRSNLKKNYILTICILLVNLFKKIVSIASRKIKILLNINAMKMKNTFLMRHNKLINCLCVFSRYLN